jgi:hypothetical protein
MYAVYLSEKEYGAPCFTNLKTAKVPMFNQHVMSIPIWNYDGKF